MLQCSSALLQIQSLNVATVTGKTLLCGVNFSLEAGECLAVIGPNGSGKSTLLRTLISELTPVSGQIFYQGQPLARLGRMGRARSLALLAQQDLADPNLSVMEYVSLGRIPYHTTDTPATYQQAINQALEDTGLMALCHRRLARLSGGERQRAALARAFAQTPQLLLLDEPTNHLDPLARISLLRRVKSKGIAVIAVLHDLALIEPFAHRVMIIHEGRMLCCDYPSRIFSSTHIYNVFGMETVMVSHPNTGKALPIFQAPESAL